MKRRYYFVLLFSGIISLGQGQAQLYIEKCLTTKNLNAISFCDSNTGWIVGERGTMLFWSGNGWKEYQEITGKNLNSVFLLNKNDGWAVGDYGLILHFNGENWEPFDSPTKNDLFSVSFQDSGNGVAVGDFGTILIYNDGNWNLSGSAIRGNFYSVFSKKDEAWIGGGLECINVPLIKMGINKNENSITNSFDPYATIRSIMFSGPEDGWAVGSPSIMIHYNGIQWERVDLNENCSSLNSVFFSEKNEGISVGYGGTVLTCLNNSWNKEKPITNQKLNGAVIIKNKCFAVGDSGTIIQMDLAQDDIVNDIGNNDQEKINVYPNPCDEFLNIVVPFNNDDSGVSVSIYNLSGEIIMQNDLTGTRTTTYPLITRNLKNGIYMIRMTVGSKTAINRFVVRH